MGKDKKDATKRIESENNYENCQKCKGKGYYIIDEEHPSKEAEKVKCEECS